MFRQKIATICFCGVLLTACTYNLGTTWVEPISAELQLNKLVGKKTIIVAKKQKNFLRKKNILLLRTFSEEEVDKKIIEILDQRIKDSLTEFVDSGITHEIDFNEQERQNFKNKNKLFLEDFYFAFRVNKDLVKSALQTEYQELFLMPQILFWVCKTCREENLIFFRISFVDVKNGELVWFANNYYRFAKTPSKEQLEKRILLLWDQVFAKIYKEFKG